MAINSVNFVVAANDRPFGMGDQTGVVATVPAGGIPAGVEIYCFVSCSGNVVGTGATCTDSASNSYTLIAEHLGDLRFSIGLLVFRSQTGNALAENDTIDVVWPNANGQGTTIQVATVDADNALTFVDSSATEGLSSLDGSDTTMSSGLATATASAPLLFGAAAYRSSTALATQPANWTGLDDEASGQSAACVCGYRQPGASGDYQYEPVWTTPGAEQDWVSWIGVFKEAAAAGGVVGSIFESSIFGGGGVIS